MAADPEVDGFLALLAARRAPKTVDAYRRDLRALGDWLGGPPSKATSEDLERWLADLRAAGLSPATIARRIAAVRSFFGRRARAPAPSPQASENTLRGRGTAPDRSRSRNDSALAP